MQKRSYFWIQISSRYKSTSNRQCRISIFSAILLPRSCK